MKKLIILGIIIGLQVPALAAPLSTQSYWIKMDLDILRDRQKAASDQCRKLEAEIKVFNDNNNATNAALTAKRQLKVELDEQIRAAREKLAAVTASYTELTGKIAAKNDALKSLRENYFADLKVKRTNAQVERDAAKKKKDAVEIKNRDQDNFNSADEYLASIKDFYDLKNKISSLQAKFDELTILINKSNPPTQAELEAEIATLSGQAKVIYDDLLAKTAALKVLIEQCGQLVKAIAALEAKTKSLSNFEVPAICKVL